METFFESFYISLSLSLCVSVCVCVCCLCTFEPCQARIVTLSRINLLCLTSVNFGGSLHPPSADFSFLGYIIIIIIIISIKAIIINENAPNRVKLFQSYKGSLHSYRPTNSHYLILNC